VAVSATLDNVEQDVWFGHARKRRQESEVGFPADGSDARHDDVLMRTAEMTMP
jgi:hypothetical protein